MTDIKITYQAPGRQPVDLSYIADQLDYDFKRMIWNNRKVELTKPDGAIVTYEGYLGDD